MTFTNDQWQEAIVSLSNAGPSGGGTQYTDGQAPPANPIGPTLIWDNGGTWLHVSAAHPLPISGSISATNPSVSTTGAAIPASATLIGASDGANLQSLLVDASKYLKVNVAASATLPVSGTFWQATQPVSAASLPLPTNAAQETGGNLASVVTNTSNTATVAGTTSDAAVTGDNSGTLSAKLRGLTKILADIWDSVNHRIKVDGSGVTQPVSGTVTANAGTGNMGSNLTQVAGNAIATGNNAVPVLNTAATGYVTPWASNPTALTANTDAAFKWGASGTTQVNHIMIQNNSSNNIQWDLDTATNAGSPILGNVAPGNTLFLDVQTTALHLQSIGTPSLNGTSGGNIVIRGWL